jgi:excisionase family DNA binding protein
MHVINQSPSLITRTELAQRLSVHPQTIFCLTKENKIDSVKIGGSVLYDYENVLKSFQREKK